MKKLTHDNHYALWLLMIIVIAILLRFCAAIYLGESLESEQQRRIQDQVSYNALAHSLLSGRGYSFENYWYPFITPNTPTAFWSFLYPLFLASIYFVFGYYPLAARIIQAIISGILSCWLLYLLGRRLASERVGLLSAGLGALYAYFIFHDAALMTESFFILGVLAMLNLALKMSDKNDQGIRDWLLLGGVLGVSALLRQTILLWLPFLFIWIWWAKRGQFHWRGPVLSLAVILAFILPWTVRNYLVYHAFLPLNSNAGYALYSANHPDQGTHFDQDYAAPLPPDLVIQGLNEAQLNTALTRRGLQFILEDPRRYLLLSLNKITIFFNFWFSPESSLSSNLMRVFSFGLYLPFFLFGLFLSRRNWRRSSLIYLFVLVYSAMHILSWASIRYRLPVDAALMPMAGLAVSTLIEKASPIFQEYLPLHLHLEKDRQKTTF